MDPSGKREIEDKVYAALGLGRGIVTPIEPREEPDLQAVEPEAAGQAA